jgi:hypothetical protein
VTPPRRLLRAALGGAAFAGFILGFFWFGTLAFVAAGIKP